MASEGDQGRSGVQGMAPREMGFDSCGVGFVVHVRNVRSHSIVEQGLKILLNLSHRGATGAEPNTGDGAGILLQVPHLFLRRVTAPLGIRLPAEGEYAVGQVFLPRDPAQRLACESLIEGVVEEEGQYLHGWRDVPRDSSSVGPSALACEPVLRQVFIGRSPRLKHQDDFERRLFLIRKRAEHGVAALGLSEGKSFYIASLSSRTVIYKGMLTPEQVGPYFKDLADPDVVSSLALVHSRFSTNTFPSWDLAQPFRYLAHNGEINTLRGNINWMRAREALFENVHFPREEIRRLLPLIRDGQSDSATLDNALEVLLMCERSLPHAIMMLIPEAWSGNPRMPKAKRDFYRYHACLMEPWDGPASVAFTDGRYIGAVLDRNGLRPSRYYVTKDDLVIMASEVGVLDVPPDRVLRKGRLEPGRMFLVDLAEGRIIGDEEIKDRIVGQKPYGEWLGNLRALEDLPPAPALPAADPATRAARQCAFGYTHEDLRVLMAPMALNGEEAVGSMGDDTPLAVLSDRPQPLFHYFRQLFAQVTNPPLDAIREELVTSIGTTLGPEGNLFEPGPGSCLQIELKSPILTDEELARLLRLEGEGFPHERLSILFPADGGAEGLARAMEDLCGKASRAVERGARLLLLSDRGVDAKHAPIPSLMAVAGVHHHLIRTGQRTLAGILLESGEPREVHHFATLIGYGANAVNPTLAFETLDELLGRGELGEDLDLKGAVKNYIKAVNKGIVKIMSKMGISTVQSYRGAQIFEAVGLNREFVDRYFTHTPTRLQGIGLAEVARETLVRHARAFDERRARELDLETGGRYRWRRDGEAHLFNPETVTRLQRAVREGDYGIFREYSRRVDDQSRALCTLRGLFRFRKTRPPVPLAEVEPESAIVKRFATGAMSYGSISQEAHETLAIAMNRLGGKSNTGEGGEDEERYQPLPNGDSRCSAVKQVASGRFGVTSHYLVNAKEIQIKMAQGAKPGEGGQLPARKVYPWIARTRHSTPFVQLISPPPHHDIYSIEDLAQLIHDLKNANDRARISVKLVAEFGVGTVAAGVCKAHADHVLISGHDGGTGASPLTSIKHAGIPWEMGLSETHQTLVANRLRDRIVVQADGQMKTGRDVVVAALLGAEEFGFGTTALVAEGCIMMRVCHLDTCPVGVATQNPDLRRKFTGKPEHVVNFMTFVAREAREWMAELGFRSIDEMVGHTEVLETGDALDHWKARGLDFSGILFRPPEAEQGPVHCVRSQDHGLERAIDHRLIEMARPALEEGKPVRFEVPVRNTNRTVGTLLGSEISRRHGSAGLPDDTIRIGMKGTAGQSFAAFVPRGVTFRLEGDANDYLGKGLCGARVIVVPPAEASFTPEENVLVGNVAFYGATSGEGYVRGLAGERFCVRNSGVNAVVEGVGDHGCEYMTGGRVVVLGPTGRNFAAGMSGGIAYVLDEAGDFRERCNTGMVGLETLDAEDLSVVRSLVERHFLHTGSAVARRVLDAWDRLSPRFVKVIPTDYKKALEGRRMTAGAVRT
jgi:glutamate synthase (ferredoxin)